MSLPTSQEHLRNWEVPFISIARDGTKALCWTTFSVNVGSQWGFHLCPFAIPLVSTVSDSTSPHQVRGPSPPSLSWRRQGLMPCGWWGGRGGGCLGAGQKKVVPFDNLLCVSWSYCHMVLSCSLNNMTNQHVTFKIVEKALVFWRMWSGEALCLIMAHPFTSCN